MLKLMDTAASKRPDDLSGHEHRRLLGLIGFLLPLILIAIVLWRDGRDAWLRLDSVSAYYYSGAVSAFAGMLVAFALVLFTYRGYMDASGKPQKADRRCAIVGGWAALGVALFPTSAPQGFTPLPWVEQWVVTLHFLSAAVLFGVFAIFCVWLFRKKAPGNADHETAAAKADKEGRNAVYFICGLVIVACMGWALFEGVNQRSIFWPESVALMFFAISWLVKGYADSAVVKGASRLSYWFVSLFVPKAGAVDDEQPSDR